MRHIETEGRRSYLEQQRREINEALAYGEPEEPNCKERRGRRRADDFGPPWGFGSVGDYFGQNQPWFRFPRE